MDFLKAAIVEYFVIQVLIQDISCETWEVYLPQKVIGIQGSCVVIPCTFNYPGVEKQSNDVTILWYKDNENSQQYTEIYHSKNNLISLADSYILVGDSGKKNCSLKITKLQKKDEEHYHLRVEIAQLGAFSFIKQTAYVSVSGNEEAPKIDYPKEMTEGNTFSITCKIDKACVDYPPKFIWNRTLLPSKTSWSFQKESWEATSLLEFIPSFQDNGKLLICEVQYSEGKSTLSANITLKILYKPKINRNSECTFNETQFTCYCQIDSNPVSSIMWHLPDRTINDSNKDEMFRTHSSVSGTIFRSVITGPLGIQDNISCSASNHQGYETLIFTIPHASQTSSGIKSIPQMTWIASSAAGLFLIIIVITAVVCKQCHKRNKSSPALNVSNNDNEYREERNHKEDSNSKSMKSYYKIQQRSTDAAIYSNAMDNKREGCLEIYQNVDNDPSHKPSCFYDNLEYGTANDVYANM